MCEVPQLTDLDLTGIDTVAIDLETYDPNLKTKVKKLFQLWRGNIRYHTFFRWRTPLPGQRHTC